jgi:hypothetical protein
MLADSRCCYKLTIALNATLVFAVALGQPSKREAANFVPRSRLIHFPRLTLFFRYLIYNQPCAVFGGSFILTQGDGRRDPAAWHPVNVTAAFGKKSKSKGS